MNNILKFMMSLLIVFTLGSCSEDWLNINKDPNVPTTPELSQLLSFSQVNMSKSLSQGDFIGNNLSGYVHQLVSRETQNYGMGTQANGIYNSWNYMYRYALVNFDAIVANAEPQGNMIYAGVAKTLKVYLFSMMVDLWGDLPYSEFNIPGLTAPNADSSKDIYNALIVLLDDAKADLEDTEAANLTVPGTDDLIYGGDEAKWIRLNNTIKLKLLLQSRKAKSDVVDWQAKFDALIAADNFIDEGEDFQFWYNATTNPTDERHPAYIDEYAGGQVTYYVSPFFYEVMKGETLNVTDNPFGGIVDPRIPYYFFNQLKGNDSQNPHEYRNGNFMSIFFASAGPNSAHANDGSTTKIGIYPCGGKYDDGNGGTISKFEQGNGAAPHKMITYAALKFMLAELALTGETTADAKVLFTDAMKAAIDHVNTVASKQEGVPVIANTTRDNFVNTIVAKYDAANNAGKLRILMTQKWIHNFFNPIDSYTDYRRTGYPTLFDPSKTQNPGFGVNPTVTAKSAAAVPLENIASFPRSLYYPTTSETNLNPNVSQKVNLSTPFVFWDK
ncbi:hypothetical protein SDC9_38877 [bioreactor metagenome]|jgi:hypothetical protein|uniref:SusD/RagB family nutrient-binding outer membrane lipoprotein n=1 Tax=bioreactor metagenome TaxID=1076179 RepID=A0A644VMY9_9ZZZZ|nr:SusD/RagB family nutrient-binding outer membrane lipoprotein [Paludibacter sp.]